MKNKQLTTLIIFCTVLIFLSACNFSVGTNKDLKTGLSISYNGFTVKEVYMTDQAGNRLSSNKIPLGSTMHVIANNVGGYTLKDGKAYPGCAITVTDKTGKIMGTLPDVLEEVSKNGLEPANATLLSTDIRLSPPFVVGQTYHLNVRFFDKQNAKSKITADVDLTLE